MIRSFPLLFAPAICLAVFNPAHADMKSACAADGQAVCSGVAPKDGKLRDCMAENRAKLSNECKLAIADRLLERQAKKADALRAGKPAEPAGADE